jgi:ribose-phosphate pyrophosphokinase
MNIIGEIAGRNIFIFDDMIDTAGTIVNASYALKEKGAGDVYACCTHPIFSGDALNIIAQSPLKEVIVTDTITLNDNELTDKICVVSVASLLGEAIRRIHNYQSVSALFS